MSALYGEVISEHFRRPRNQGSFERADAWHEELNPLCGDRVRIELRLSEGRIAEARFRGDACMVVVASASLLTERVRGLSMAEASRLSREEVLGALQTELRPARVPCALLPLEALRGALARAPGGAG
ncbi:MAG TPA: iron-sulfur cluster assembly scaffold protein [Myxococcales bacterium]|nr:iron-sulfur cluster assembly scaffold protein [Myxococcales bacterium]